MLLVCSLSQAATLEENLSCQTRAAVISEAASARDRNFPMSVFIQGQLQTRYAHADEDSIMDMKKLAEEAYTTFYDNSPGWLKYTYNRVCLRNLTRK